VEEDSRNSWLHEAVRRQFLILLNLDMEAKKDKNKEYGTGLL
jgi:hypothetical protein